MSELQLAPLTAAALEGQITVVICIAQNETENGRAETIQKMFRNYFFVFV